MPPDNDLLLGEIKGKLDLMLANQNDHNTKLDNVTQRLTSVESKASSSGAQLGALTGLLVSVGFSLIKEKLGIHS